MKYGSFIDMYQNEITVSATSNVKGGMWLHIESSNGETTSGHLSVLDAKVLIAILSKAIEAQEED